MPLQPMGERLGEAELIPRHELLPLLGTVHKEGNNIFAYCPVHNDGQKSKGKGGRAGRSLILYESGVLQCAAGCSTRDVLDALGARNGHTPQQPEQKTLVATYEYRYPDGTYAGTKYRYEPKTFRWDKPDDTPMSQMPLWGIEHIVQQEGRVWICEGEKATEAVRARGELATCGGWGASQRDYGDAFSALSGRDIFLWPDNDEAGREYMQAVARHLKEKGIANKLATISAPVPLKGDAHDYFSFGGTLDALLEDMLFNPTVDVLAANHLRVKVPVETGVAVFDFDNILKTGRSLQADMSVSLGEAQPYEQEINILSQSTRDGLIKQLNQLFGKDVNWAAAINTAYSRMRSTLREVQTHEAELLNGIPDRAPTEMVLEPFIIDGGGTVLFGPPKRGKSWTAMLMAVSVDAGVETCWGIPRQRHVLYVNLERPAKTLANRISAVNETLGLLPERALRTINARGKSLVDVYDSIKASIREHGVELVVLDSMSRAGLGDLNENQTGNRIMDILNSLDVAWLAIGHSPRGDETHLFGSVMQDAAADVMVAMSAEERMEVGVLGVTLRATHANDIPTPPPERWAYHMDSRGISGVRRAKQGEFVEMESNTPAPLRQVVKEYLLDAGKASPSVIAEEIDRPRQKVQQVLKGPEFTTVGRDGRSVLYAVAANENVSPRDTSGVTRVTGGEVSPLDTSRGVTGDTSEDLGPCQRCKRLHADHMLAEGPACSSCFELEMSR